MNKNKNHTTMKNKSKTNKSKEIESLYDFSKYKLNTTDKRVLTLKLEGKQQTTIAKELKLTESTVSIVTNKPECIRAYNDFSKTWMQKIIDAKSEATEIYLNILRNDKTPIKLRSDICEKIIQIDKVGGSKANIDIPDDLENLNEGEINELYKKIKQQ